MIDWFIEKHTYRDS